MTLEKGVGMQLNGSIGILIRAKKKTAEQMRLAERLLYRLCHCNYCRRLDLAELQARELINSCNISFQIYLSTPRGRQLVIVNLIFMIPSMAYT